MYQQFLLQENVITIETLYHRINLFAERYFKESLEYHGYLVNEGPTLKANTKKSWKTNQVSRSLCTIIMMVIMKLCNSCLFLFNVCHNLLGGVAACE